MWLLSPKALARMMKVFSIPMDRLAEITTELQSIVK